jgi:D-alanine-D-alanine ligase
MDIAIIFGASSYEHEISIVSAITLKSVVKSHNLKFIFIDSNREFYLIDDSDMKSKFFSSKEYLKKGKKLKIDKEGFYIGGLFGSKKVDFDVALNLIHGRDGEDGKVASMLEFFNIKYIGPRVEASAISYNKLYTKLFAESLGVKVIDYKVLNSSDSRDVELTYPVIIKPLRLGSSIGVSIVKSKEDLDYALDVAFEFDNQVLIEPFIEGIKEYNLAGSLTKDWQLSIIEEPAKEEFLDFDKKYLDFARDERVQEANIDEALKNKIRESFKSIYNPVFNGAIIRCDFFVIDDEVYLNEINPIPGSMANYLFEDFNNLLSLVATNLPTEKNIKIEYMYINNIQKAKGKA